MKICTNCGNKLTDDEKKCSVCKTKAKDFPTVDDNDEARAKEIIEAVKTRSVNGKDMTAKKKRGKGCLIAIIVVVALGVIGALAGGGDSENNNPQIPVDGNVASDTQGEGSTSEGSASVEDYEVVGDFTTEKDSFAFYIRGTLKNNKSRDLSYAQVTFNLYDADGNQIGTAFDNINNWEAGGTWKFKAMGIGEDGEVASYKYMGVDAF